MPENPTKFQRLWYNKRTNAAMKLGIWSIFILALVIFMAIADGISGDDFDKEVDNSNNNIVLYSDVLNDFLLQDYSFEYNIRVMNYSVRYHGKLEKNIESGYKENDVEVIKYRIENGLILRVSGETEVPIDDLYEYIYEKFLDREFLQILLKTKNYEEKDNVFTYSEVGVNEENYIIEVEVNEKYVNNITIKSENSEYKLAYEFKE